jgi:hypothetical protein
MNDFVLKLRPIAILVVLCCVAGASGRVTQAQTSGALLSVSGNHGAVNFNVYDSQIHSGAVNIPPANGGTPGTPPVPPCDGNWPTDAYVLQGGSWTGCDSMDAYEVTDNNGSGGTHQSVGKRDIACTVSGCFHIETHYIYSTNVLISAATATAGTTTYTYTLNPAAGALNSDFLVGEKVNVTGFSLNNNANDGMFVITAVTPPGSFSVKNANGVTENLGCGGGPCGSVTSVCNTNGTICAGPDTGLLQITNNTGSAFSGTMTLQGNSLISSASSSPNASFCPQPTQAGGPGVAFDQWTNLSAGQSVILALSTDSSNCGGFNQPLVNPATGNPYPLTGTVKFLMGDSNLVKTAAGLVDEFDVTPAGANAGDTVQLLPMPVPAGPLTDCISLLISPAGTCFGSESVAPFQSITSRFQAVKYPNQASIPIESLSAPGNPVGLQLDVKCFPGPNPPVSDCDSFLWSGQQWFHVDPNSYGDNKIGGVAYLGQHGIDTVTTMFNFNAYISYTDGPLHPGNSVYAGTFTPGAPAIVGTDVSKILVGFQRPVSDADWNLINKGQAVSLKFTSTVTGLTECGNLTGSGCGNTWLNVSMLPITCKNGMMNTATLFDASATGASGLQEVPVGSGNYVFTLDTPKNPTFTCFTPVLTFSNGPSIYYDGTPASLANSARFQFK